MSTYVELCRPKTRFPNSSSSRPVPIATGSGRQSSQKLAATGSYRQLSAAIGSKNVFSRQHGFGFASSIGFAKRSQERLSHPPISKELGKR
jgi:hypothetical protein